MSDTTPSSPSTPAKSRTGLWVGIAIVVVVVLAGGGYLLFGRKAPEAANLSTATQGISGGTTTSKAAGASTSTSTPSSGGTTGSTGGSAGGGTTATSAAGAEGTTWTIDSSVTSDAGGTFAGFRVEEELASIGSTTAVGRTSGVEGSLVLDGSTLVSGSFTVDMTTLATDNQLRDGQVKRVLETATFPEATFTITGPVELTTSASDGASLTADVPGSFTIHGVTRTATVKVDASITGNVLTIVGSAPFTFAEYEIDAPTSQAVLSLEEQGTLEFQLYLTS